MDSSKRWSKPKCRLVLFPQLVWHIYIVQAEDGDSFFIDRSPKHFETVLNYIRSGDVDLPDSENELKELKREAEYYSLEKLATLCQSSMPKIKSYKTADELLNMIANTKKVIFYK